MTDIVVFLDDDCTVQEDWLREIAEVLRRHPTAAVVLGAVCAARHDSNMVFIPWTGFARETILHGRRSILFLRRAGRDARIMSANMCVLRSAVASAGPFDVYLGPGAQFGIAEDIEYVYRVLRSGGCVVMTPAVQVLHHGARSYAGGAVSRMFRTVAYAVGAVDIKLLRCGEWLALAMMAAHVAQYLRWIQPANLLQRRGPTGLAWIAWYFMGLTAGINLKLDRRRLLFGGGDEQAIVPRTNVSAGPTRPMIRCSDLSRRPELLD